MKEKLGFIGLGNLGLPMSINFLRAGYEVFGFDINAKAIDRFIAEDGVGLATLQDVIKQSDVIMTSLPTPQAVEQVYKAQDGILQHAKQIDFSTVNPQLNDLLHKEARSLGLRYLGTCKWECHWCYSSTKIIKVDLEFSE
ncbi:3-hydroxyisobutyrate dehydrogenase-like beta-hydroxyacid dehydrogenase [Lysinibacillus parviboronicapiens]|uniref:3-hydroxyisobutyrate dehydrogenase-like beta-hydroxyacid dehydrogenase n=1 Tax=Lysinibacillus parviboronicapiens TaxID=436516 RepID=A0ABV2PFJ2_9BACI